MCRPYIGHPNLPFDYQSLIAMEIPTLTASIPSCTTIRLTASITEQCVGRYA